VHASRRDLVVSREFVVASGYMHCCRLRVVQSCGRTWTQRVGTPRQAPAGVRWRRPPLPSRYRELLISHYIQRAPAVHLVRSHSVHPSLSRRNDNRYSNFQPETDRQTPAIKIASHRPPGGRGRGAARRHAPSRRQFDSRRIHVL